MARELLITDYDDQSTIHFFEDPANPLSMVMIMSFPFEQDHVWNLSPEHADQIAYFLDGWANHG